MVKIASSDREQVISELNALPDEYLPMMLQIVRTFKESILLKPAAESFRQGWREARQGKTTPVSTLWDGIDAE